MADTIRKVLVVESKKKHADQLHRQFSPHSDSLQLLLAGSLGEARAELGSDPDLVIAQYTLPDGSGVDFLSGGDVQVHCPVVIIVSPGGEEGRTCLRAGALDYVLESEELYADFVHVAVRALEQWDLQRSVAALRTSGVVYNSLFERAAIGIVRTDLNALIVEANPTFRRMLGYSAAELSGTTMLELTHPDDRGTEKLRLKATMAMVHDVYRAEKRYLHKNGEAVWANLTVAFVRDDAGQPFFAIHTVENITIRKHAESSLERLSTAVEQAPDTIVVTDTDGTIEYANPAFERVTGYSRGEAVGKTFRLVKSGRHSVEFYRRLWDTINGGKVWEGHFVNKRKDGALYQEDATIAPVRDDAGEIANFVRVARDVTHEIELQEELQQTQKMEAIGDLAESASHGFNNLLAPILGYADKILLDLAENSPLRADMRMIRQSAARAGELVQRLQAFSCQQVLDLQPLNLNSAVDDFTNMLSRLIGDDVELVKHLEADLGTVEADKAKFQHVLMNLAVNARAAMSEGGTLTIETSNVELDERYAATHPGVNSGPYVLLVVSDTGNGMDEATRRRVFEPFFTTRGQGKAAGLGLSVVYGIVRQHSGHIWVYSEPGLGTTFKVYLPRVPAAAAAQPQPEEEKTAAPPEPCTILVVEDEDSIRQLVGQVLAMYGYEVLSAEAAKPALALAKQCRKTITLLLTDIVMPQMNGVQLYEQLLKKRPDLKVVYMSGYTENVNIRQGRLQKGAVFLQKPFTVKKLLEKISEAVGA